MLEQEIIAILEREKSVTLATCSGGRVTARTISHVNDGLTIIFQTSRNSEKVRQIKENPLAAIAVGNLQIEAVCEICWRPGEDELFLEKYKQKFPEYFERYTHLPEEVMIKAYPIRARLYRYIDELPTVEEIEFEAPFWLQGV